MVLTSKHPRPGVPQRPSSGVLVVGFALAAAACTANGGEGSLQGGQGGVDTGSGGNGAGGLGGAAMSLDPPTYHRDVKPLLDRHCAGCHAAGGIAPFVFDSYEATRKLAGLIASVTSTGRMPPWLPSSDCAPLKDERRLTAAEIERLATWESAGAPEGDPTTAPLSQRPVPRRLEDPDVTVDIGFDYQPNTGQSDDYRCFIADPKLSAARDLVGAEVIPGDRRIVHHTLVYAVQPSDVSMMVARDEGDQGPGFACNGLDGKQRLVAWWVPGESAVAYPEGTGARLEPGTVFVLQIHYNSLISKDGRDRSTLKLDFSDQPVAQQAQVRPVADTSIVIPPGDSEAAFATDFPVPVALTLLGTAPHMHMLGKSLRVELIRPGESPQCVINIPSWDFNWQQFYQFVTPIKIPKDSKIKLTCVYDNSAEKQPVISGQRQEPREVRWGEGTLDEMCLNYVFVTAGIAKD